MVKTTTYLKQLSEINALISSIKMYAGLAESLSEFVSVTDSDENDNVSELFPLHKEHLVNMKATGQQLSSFADRLNSRLVTIEKMVKEIEYPSAK